MSTPDLEANLPEKASSLDKPIDDEKDVKEKKQEDHDQLKKENNAGLYADEPLNINPWEKCVELSRKYDDEMCEVLKDELDNLLIFAALFSAIVAAFTIDSYKWLHPNDQNPSPVTEQVAIQVNVLLFLSLAASIGVASLGILCMQWVRQFRVWQAKPSFRTLAMRRQRFVGFQSWLVPEIISFLPVLMQAALVLFGIGVIRLLWALHHAVANAFMVVSVVTIAFVLLSMFAPVFQWWLMHWKQFPHLSKQCPYQSPQAWFCYLLSWLVSAALRTESAREDPGNWQKFDNSWMNLAVKKHKNREPSYEEKMVCEELIWLDQESSHDIAGIQARAEALSLLHIKSAEAIVTSLRPFKPAKNTPHQKSSEPTNSDEISLPKTGDKDDVFREEFCRQYNSPEYSKKVKDKSSKAKHKLLKVWYLWAHGRNHPSLDDAYMDARIQFMLDLPQDEIVLPGLRRAEHLDIHLLVQAKDGKNDRRVCQYLECLITIVSKSRYMSEDLKEIWSNIGDFLEYSIQHDYTKYFPILSRLFHAFRPSMSLGSDADPTKPVGPVTHADMEIAQHMLGGLNFLFSLHADQRLNPLSEDNAEHIEGLSSLVLSLDNAGTALDRENWKALKVVLAAWMPTSSISEQLTRGDTPSGRTSVAYLRDSKLGTK